MGTIGHTGPMALIGSRGVFVVRKPTCCRQLSVALVVLGLWISSTVFAANVCTVDGCRDDCEMHKLVLAHEMAKGACGRQYHTAALVARCTCGEIHRQAGTAPATFAAEASTNWSGSSPLQAAVLPAAQPHLPFYARFIGKEPTPRLVKIDAPASLGLRAPPVA